MLKRLLAFTCVLGFASTAMAADLTITVTGLTTTEGVTRVVIIADPDGLAHQDASRNVPLTGAKDGQVSTTFLGLAPGSYGVVAIEENGVNHAIEKALTGTVAAPRATSTEIRFTLAEPKATVFVPLHPTETSTPPGK